MSDILKELLGTVSDTFDNSIQALSEPNRIINALKSSTESSKIWVKTRWMH
ncbi:hypothetical protein BSPWISOXPB_251 [uncultured Gammaproteobacteria bacterium]|nr:hypothetical protein BSPWISOXPB_251 [uncultured Gammaproteobacteria bacterium]